jgi:hypothetical protein
MTSRKFPINRAPVLTLWAFVVAMRQGHDEATALTLGQALAALNAQSKGRRLGIYDAGEKQEGEEKRRSPATSALHLLGREIPIVKVGGAIRAAPGGEPIKPEAVRTYLEKKFGENLAEARAAMEALARSVTPTQLEARAFPLYEKFRPQVPEGKKGWGAKGELDLDMIRRLAK